MKTSYCHYILGAVLLAAAAFAGCSHKKSSDTAETTEQAAAPEGSAATVNRKPKGDIRQQIEKGTLSADDLTADDAVTALTIYYEICSEAKNNGRYKAANEAMRNYVDVYDIVKSNRQTEFTRIADRTVVNDGTMNLTDIYTHFQERLAQYEGGGTGGNAATQPTDSMQSQQPDSVTQELAPELRPAE